MAEAAVSRPATGARVVTAGDDVVLFGQPLEVLKGLLLTRTSPFTALVLSDIRERDGTLTNNLEFPLYFFLFVTGAFFRGERLVLIGNDEDISHQLRLLRLTLLGPTPCELDSWDCDPRLKEEWAAVTNELALKDENGEIVDVDGFFDLRPFVDGKATAGDLTIEHTGTDHYTVSATSNTLVVDLNEDEELEPAYPVQADYTPGGLVKFGLEVLGGASGFTPNEPCTGLALCFNGDYILIDSIPFLDDHLFARGISKNQLQAGDVIGEMAIVTGARLRNASVVARTPVTVCVFSEDTFAAFLDALGFDDALLQRWRLRPTLRSLPLFEDLTSTVLEKRASIGEYVQLTDGTRYTADPGAW